MSTKTIKLSTGSWPYQEILPGHWVEYYLRCPASPERPYREVKVDGTDVPEKLDLPDDDSRMIEYIKADAAWNRQALDFMWLMTFAPVIVPDDWKVSPGEALALGIEVATDERGRKVQYIRHVILGTNDDRAAASAASDGTITKEEREAGARPFPDDEGDETGEMGTAGSDTAGTVSTECPAGK